MTNFNLARFTPDTAVIEARYRRIAAEARRTVGVRTAFAPTLFPKRAAALRSLAG